jgi:hypothetical protein
MTQITQPSPALVRLKQKPRTAGRPGLKLAVLLMWISVPQHGGERQFYLPIYAEPAADGRGGQGWLPSFAFVQIAFTHDQIHGLALATNLIFEIAIPFGKQGGHDAPGWGLVSQGLVADPLSDLELVKTRHSSRCHTGPTNAKPATRAGYVFTVLKTPLFNAVAIGR